MTYGLSTITLLHLYIQNSTNIKFSYSYSKMNGTFFLQSLCYCNREAQV